MSTVEIDGKIPQKEEKLGTEGPETSPDRPLLDLSDAAVQAFIRTAKMRGYVTHDQINALLASDEVNSEQIENILAMFSEIGINVIETKEARLEEELAACEKPHSTTNGAAAADAAAYRFLETRSPT